MIPKRSHEPGDPAAPWWTYQDLEAVFGTTRVRRMMAGWEAMGFPAPLPWSSRERRWAPAAVQGWKARMEARAQGHANLRVAS